MHAIIENPGTKRAVKFNGIVERGHNVLSTKKPIASEALLPRVARGDQSAVVECLDRYGNLVWSLARRQCATNEMAEDAVQDIFIQLWKVAGRFDEAIASETTFISMIARRRLIDLHRRNNRLANQVTQNQSSDIETLVAVAPDAAQQAEMKDEAAKAEAFLKQLPNEQQKVIRLSVYEGLSHSRIAAATGLSLGTVKTHIRRGMMELRGLLFPKGESA